MEKNLSRVTYNFTKNYSISRIQYLVATASIHYSLSLSLCKQDSRNQTHLHCLFFGDINELLLSNDEELTNDDFIQLETFQNSEENTELYDVPTPIKKKFSTKGLAEAFNLIDEALSKLEAMDSNTERFENVNRCINSDMSIYKAIYDEKKRATRQSTLDMFMRPSTSAGNPEPT